MNRDVPLSTARAVGLVARGAGLELVRRHDFYVLFMLMAIFVAGVLVVRAVGIDNPSTGTFLLNLGLTLASLPAHIVTLLVAARQIPEELENRTVYPMLAKPLPREAFVAGKWAAAAVSGVAVYAVLTGMAWAVTPKLESYSAPLFAQAVCLQALSLAAVASMAMAFSLLLPRVLAVVLAAGVVFLGGKAAAILVNSTRGETFAGAARWLALYVPDFDKLNLVTRYTDGIGPLAGAEFAGLAAYALVLAAFFFAVSLAAFRRRVL